MDGNIDTPRAYEVPIGCGRVTLRWFRPGIDRVLIQAARLETTLLAEELESGVALILRSSDDETTVVFDRLSSLPLSDVSVRVPVANGGHRVISLADIGDTPAEQDDRAKPQPRSPLNLSRPITEFVLRPGQPIPRFSSFMPGAHVIEVDMPADGRIYPKVDVRPSADGLDGVLLLDGKAAAILNGAPYATPADIRLMPRKHQP